MQTAESTSISHSNVRVRLSQMSGAGLVVKADDHKYVRVTGNTVTPPVTLLSCNSVTPVTHTYEVVI